MPPMLVYPDIQRDSTGELLWNSLRESDDLICTLLQRKDDDFVLQGSPPIVPALYDRHRLMSYPIAGSD